jgi:two-component system sensor histidine kinase HydH
MKVSLRASSLIAALLCWALLSALTVFLVWGLRDRARLIRDNDNERLFNLLFTSLRHYDNFGSAIESSPFLRDRITGFGIYGDDLSLAYRWGAVPPVFDEEILRDQRAVKNGRYTIPDKRGHRIKFILHTEGMMPMPPSRNRGREESRSPEKPRDFPQNLPPQFRQDGGFFSFLTRGKYLYIDISHPAYWRTQTSTAILFPFCELALLALVFFVRGLYLRNHEYRERIENQKNLVVLGGAASTLAHEIKNPLLSIRIQTGILEKLFPDKGGEELGIINEEVDRLSALIYRVNDYLRDAAGQPSPLNSYKLLSETSRRLCGRNIVEDGAVRDGMILMDTERARSVFENLLRNALESGSPGEAIGASIARTGGSGSGILVISIYDRGRGIAEGNLKRVFDPFFTSKSAGTGIGLSISKRFVEAVKGSIMVEQRPGGGTMVSVTLEEFEDR